MSEIASVERQWSRPSWLSSCLCYTDGITEATDAAGAYFGQERILAAARSAGGFRAGAPREDDATVAVRVASAGSHA